LVSVISLAETEQAEHLGVWPGPNSAGLRDNGKIRASGRLTYLIFPHILNLDQENQGDQDSDPPNLFKPILARVVYSLRNDR
jgi:hypothetical protein